MTALTKRIETLEKQHSSENAADVLLRHLGVLDAQMSSKVRDVEVKAQSRDDKLIANLIAGAEKAVERR